MVWIVKKTFVYIPVNGAFFTIQKLLNDFLF